MDVRVAFGTAAFALIALPLGWQLYNSTSITPPGAVSLGTPSMVSTEAVTDGPAIAAAKEEDKTDASANQVGLTQQSQDLAVAQFAPEAAPVADGGLANRKVSTVTVRPDGTLASETNIAAAPPAPEPMVAGEVAMDSLADATSSRALAPMAAAKSSTMRGGQALTTAVPLEVTGDNFASFDESPLKIAATEPVSTFSIDVDTASYSYVRSTLDNGYLPEPDSVRLEELINYFPYDYPAPTSADTPFKATMAVIPTPWNAGTQLLEIGIKGYVPPPAERQPENLTFLIDTSGSMNEPNKLPLLIRSFGLLVDQLQPEDTVSIVAYAGSAGIVLPPTKASQRTAILSALDNLTAGGSTAGAEGIELAYQLAEENKVDGGVNRVILATDGDFNVGISDPEDLKTFIKTKRDSGVFLSVLGFGRGNLDDALMQSLAQNGNGNASYIDNFSEARKVLVEEGGANLVTIAKDVKIQVEFNPAVVSEYRLIGYETRALNREDFNNDAVDAGEIGAGHTVTALYEITPVGSGAELNDALRYQASTATETTAASDEIGFLKIRYKAPDGDVSKLITTPIDKSLVTDDIAAASDDQRFAAAVAAFGQKLKASNYGENITWDQISGLAQGAEGEDPNGYRAGLLQLIDLAKLLEPDHTGHGLCDDPNGGKGNCPVPTE